MRMRNSIAFAGLVSFALFACDRSSDRVTDPAGTENLAIRSMDKIRDTGGSARAGKADAGGTFGGKGGTGGESSKPLGTGGSRHQQPVFADSMDASVRDTGIGGMGAGDRSAEEDDAGTDEYGCKRDERPYIGTHFVFEKKCFEDDALFACIPRDAICVSSAELTDVMAQNGDCWVLSELCGEPSFDGFADGCAGSSYGGPPGYSPCQP